MGSSRKAAAVAGAVAVARGAATAAIAAHWSKPWIVGSAPPPPGALAAEPEMPVFRSAATADVPPAAAATLADLPNARADRERALVAGVGSGRFGVFAAPTTAAGACFTTPVGAGCVDRFDDSGVILVAGMDTDAPATPAARELLAGLAADRVSALWVLAGSQRLPVVLRQGGFVYEAPMPGVWADELLVKLHDGSTRTIRVSNANRP